jgi:hypothetical protein
MKLFRKSLSLLAPVMAVLLVLTVLPIKAAFAGMVSTDQLIDSQTAQVQRAKVNTFMQRDDVRQQLESWGVDSKRAQQRVASLSDSEISQISERIDQMPAGQGVIGFIILAGILLFVVLLITDIIGVTHVFSFVNKPSQR